MLLANILSNFVFKSTEYNFIVATFPVEPKYPVNYLQFLYFSNQAQEDQHLPWPVAITVYCKGAAAGKGGMMYCALDGLSVADQRAPGACKIQSCKRQTESFEKRTRLTIANQVQNDRNTLYRHFNYLIPTRTRIRHGQEHVHFASTYRQNKRLTCVSKPLDLFEISFEDSRQQ